MSGHETARSAFPEFSGTAHGRSLQLRRRLIGSVVGCAWLAACDVTLIEGLRLDEAERVSSVLHARGVATLRAGDSREPGRYRIDVGAEAVPAAIAALAADRCRPTETSLSAASDPAPLIPTPRSEHEQTNRTLALALSRSIELLPGVTATRVHVELPLPEPSLADFTLPGVPPPARATVVVTRLASAGAVEEPIRRLALQAVPGLTPQTLTVIERAQDAPKPPCPALARVGPISVVRDSARSLKAWLGAALLGNMLLASVLIYVLARRRRTG